MNLERAIKKIKLRSQERPLSEGKSDKPQSLYLYPKDLPQTEPLIIRAHHLPNYLLASEYNPHLLSDIMIGGMKASSNDHVKSNYYEEVIGPDKEDFQKRYEEELWKFVRKHPQSPVALVEGEKDALCGVCSNDHHCHLKEQKDADTLYLNNFLETATKLGITVTKADVVANFSDAPLESTRRIITTAGAIRAVFKSNKK